MPEPTEYMGKAPLPVADEDRAIRERVREVTSQVLQQGRIDTEAIRSVVRAVTGRKTDQEPPSAAAARESFTDTVRGLDEALQKSAASAHAALQQLASRGQDFTDNDLKEALISLKQLEEDYAAAAGRVAEAMRGNLRREMTELAAHAQRVGAEASTRVASMMSEFASNMNESATSGLKTMRGSGMRIALLASGVLAGVADALRDLSDESKEK